MTWLFFTALALSLGGTPILARMFKAIGFVNHPNPIVPTHVEPVPYGGGLVVFLAASMSVASYLGLEARENAFLPLAACAPLLFLGLADDVFAFKPLAKLSLQAAAITGGLFVVPVHLSSWDCILVLPLTLLVVNGLNFLDVSDGVAAGVVVPTVAALALEFGQPAAAALAGALLGFLCFNWVPARVYLGDGGSHSLAAFVVFAVLIEVKARGAGPIESVTAITLACAIPLVEFAFVNLVRIRRGASLLKGSPDHLPLRMQRMGLRRNTIALIGIVLSAAASTTMIGYIQGAHLLDALALILALGVGSLVVYIRSDRPNTLS